MNGTHYIEPTGKKVYKALLTQSGTNAPTAIVLENTLGEVPTFGYINVGSYTLNIIATLFNSSKTAIYMGNQATADNLNNTWIVSTTQIRITTPDADDANTNEILFNTAITIEVYP